MADYMLELHPLSRKQRETIAQRTASLPRDMRVENRGAAVIRRGFLTSFDGDGFNAELIVAECPESDSGITLISSHKIPPFGKALLEIQSNSSNPNKIIGQVELSRPGRRMSGMPFEELLYFTKFVTTEVIR